MVSDRLDLAFVSFAPPGKLISLRACNLARECQKVGLKVKVIFPRDRNAIGAFGDHSLVPLDGLRYTFARNARRYIAQSKPRFVHFLNPSPLAFLIVVGVRSVKIIGDWEDWHTMPSYGPIKSIAHRVADRWFIRQSHIIVTCSKWLADEFQRRFGRRCNYLPYAIDPESFERSSDPFDRPTIVFMGNLHPWWDHRLLLDATKFLKGRYPDTHVPLRIIGNGADREFCQNFAREHCLESVSFAGFLPQEQLRNELYWAHGLAFPFAGTPLNLARCPFKAFQYAQAGRPIITGKFGEVSNLLGDRAIYVDFTAESYGEAMLECVKKPRIDKIDYELEKHTWEERSKTLVKLVS